MIMNNKKTIIILILVLTIGIVGLTVAYFSNSTSIDNTFRSKEYGTTTDEDFVSPDNWLPGTTTPKTLTVTNSGNVDEAVRISYTETWTSKNAKDNDQEGDLPLKQNNNDVAIINWANTDDWTTVTENGVTYKYYKYKLAPTETTTSLLNSVTFNLAAVNNANCVEDTSVPGKKVITCDSTGNGYDGATYKLRFNVETVQYNQYQIAWGTSVAILSAKPMTIQQFIASKTNVVNEEYNDNTKGKMFVFNHEATSQTPALTDYRYIGDAPNNFVYFNCIDNTDTSTCEVWRILGVFDVERTDPSDSSKTITETRMKLVRGLDFATLMLWDNRYGEWIGSGNNDWNGSFMNTYLNETYYPTLSIVAKSQIEDAIYYLGGRIADWSGSVPVYGTTEEIYAWERGNTVYNNTRPTSWEGKVALMYPSDMYMTYAKGVENNCYNDPYKCYTNSLLTVADQTKSWVHNTNKLEGTTWQQWTWFLSPDAELSNRVMRADSDGDLDCSHTNSLGGGGARPVVYLKSSIQILSGDGSEQNPYTLLM